MNDNYDYKMQIMDLASLATKYQLSGLDEQKSIRKAASIIEKAKDYIDEKRKKEENEASNVVNTTDFYGRRIQLNEKEQK